MLSLRFELYLELIKKAALFNPAIISNCIRFLMDRDGEAAAREAIPKYISMLRNLR